MNKPLLSIVIANYNYGRFLEDAIQSIISQDMGDKIELIICDAASIDNSVDIIKKYANGLPPNISFSDWNNSQHPTPNTQLITWWCSESDGGQSAAFNKGFSHARGKFLTWLNADDVMLPGTLRKFMDAVKSNPQCEWFVGGVLWLTKDMHIIKCGRARSFSKLRAFLGEIGVWGPSSFFRKELYEMAGKIDERFYYTMDTDLWYRFYFKCGVMYRPFTKYAWGLRLHEEAKMSAHNFAESGQSDKEHPKWKQIKLEVKWMYETRKPPFKTGFWGRIMSMKVIQSLLSRIDTICYKGKCYKEIFR